MNQMMQQDGLTGGNDFARAAAAAQAASQAQTASGQGSGAQGTSGSAPGQAGAVSGTGGVRVQTLGGAQALVQEEQQE